MDGIEELHLYHVRIVIEVIKSNPRILHVPQLEFLKEWLESMGASIPPPPHILKLKAFKPGCPIEGCDSTGHINKLSNRHRVAASCPLVWKRKQEEVQGNSESAQKKQKIDMEGNRGTGKEEDPNSPKEVSSIACQVTIKQEPPADENHCMEANNVLEDFSGVSVRPFISSIENTSASEISLSIKQEVDGVEETNPTFSLTDADIPRNIEKEHAIVQQASGTLGNNLAGNAEIIIQPLSSEFVTDNFVDINSTDRNIATQTISSKSTETASSKILRKEAESSEQNENSGINMERISPAKKVVKEELDYDIDDSKTDGSAGYVVVAEWTNQQVQEAGTSDGKTIDREPSSSDVSIVKNPDEPNPSMDESFEDQESYDDSLNDADFWIESEDNHETSEDSYVSDSLETSSTNSVIQELARKRKYPEQSGIVTVQLSNNEEGKRKWDKIHYCLFCSKTATNIRKHYFGPHKSEPQVRKILDLPLKSRKRKVELLRLMNAGDYQHNMQVLKEGKGHLVTSTRHSHETSPKDYLPCDGCLGFFLKVNLWRHKQVCPLMKKGQKSRRVQAQASLLLPASTEINEGLKLNIFSKMKNDEVTIAARNDRIILKIGEKLYQKHGSLPHLYTHISQKIRELGRFLLCAREQNAGIICINDILTPEKFPVAVRSTKVLCKYDKVKNKYLNPSLALKLGHLLKKCAKLSKSEALISGNSEQANKADGFLSLCKDEWTEEISSSALTTLTRNKMNKGQMLPLSEDIIQLQSYFLQNTELLIKTLEDQFSKSKWELLNQITLAQLVVFNRRRSGETQQMTVKAYLSRKENSERPPKEVEDSLNATEKSFLSTFSRVEIRGKKGHTVPVLLTRKVQKCIDLLLKWRNKAGVALENNFVFPRPNFGSLEPLRSSDVLRRFAKEAGLTNPKRITCTRLRKHVATVAQVLSLDKNDLKILASFMGHDISAHRSFYRLPQETLQVAKMGRLLTAFNNGTIGQYNGKSIDDISLDEMGEFSTDEEDDGSEEESSENLDYITEGASDSEIENPAVPMKDKLPKPSHIQKLTKEQSCLLKTLYKTNIASRRELRREDCEEAINKYPILKSLSWKKIKNTVHNWITLEKRKTKTLSKS